MIIWAEFHFLSGYPLKWIFGRHLNILYFRHYERISEKLHSDFPIHEKQKISFWKLQYLVFKTVIKYFIFYDLKIAFHCGSFKNKWCQKIYFSGVLSFWVHDQCTSLQKSIIVLCEQCRVGRETIWNFEMLLARSHSRLLTKLFSLIQISFRYWNTVNQIISFLFDKKVKI